MRSGEAHLARLGHKGTVWDSGVASRLGVEKDNISVASRLGTKSLGGDDVVVDRFEYLGIVCYMPLRVAT